MHDVMLELDAQPFLDAGPDPEKLLDNYTLYENESGDGTMLMVGRKLDNDALAYTGSPTALAAFEQIVNKYRDAINYHASLDHYGVMLGDGNMFEWAKDMKTNTLGGAGIGLTIVKSIVLAHEGTVSAQSHANGGSCFPVKIPKGNT